MNISDLVNCSENYFCIPCESDYEIGDTFLVLLTGRNCEDIKFQLIPELVNCGRDLRFKIVLECVPLQRYKLTIINFDMGTTYYVGTANISKNG